MQLLVSKKTCAVLASAATLFCLSARCFADPITLTSSALSSTMLGPSSDSIALNAGSASFDTSGGATVFQTGDFIIGDSEIADQIIPFSFQDTVTLNGITQVLNIFGQDSVTNTSDTLSIFAGTPTLFGNETFTLDAFDATGTAIGQDLPIELQASVTPTPEPSTLLLLVTGVVGIIVLAPATRRSFGSSPGAVTPPVNFIKMPVPARSWVQRGASFHSAASDTVQALQPAASESGTKSTGSAE